MDPGVARPPAYPSHHLAGTRYVPGIVLAAFRSLFFYKEKKNCFYAGATRDKYFVFPFRLRALSTVLTFGASREGCGDAARGGPCRESLHLLF